MKIRKWCSCKVSVTCGFNPIGCLECGKIIFERASKLPKKLRKVPIDINNLSTSLRYA